MKGNRAGSSTTSIFGARGGVWPNRVLSASAAFAASLLEHHLMFVLFPAPVARTLKSLMMSPMTMDKASSTLKRCGLFYNSMRAQDWL